VADSSDKSVQSQSFQEAADLSAVLPGENALEQPNGPASCEA
jgi:hypothetical protein